MFKQFFTKAKPVPMAEASESVKPRSQVSNNLISDMYYGTIEKTFEESSYNDASQRKPYNPAPMYQIRGNHDMYDEMRFDDQVWTALQLKKDLVLSSGWNIVIQDDDQEEIKEFLDSALQENVEIPLDQMLEDVLSAYDFGFSLSEKIFKKREDGSLVLKNIKTRHPDTWLIYTDVYGNVEKVEQRGVPKENKLNYKSLFHYINSRNFQNPYGKSDLETAWAAYFTKRQIIRYYGMFLEKAASPTPVAKYPKNMPKEAVDSIYNAIKTFQAKTAMAIPEDIDLSFLESKSNGEAFIKGINLFNMFIGRSILVPDLIGLTGSETQAGSLALGKEQMGVFYKHIARRRGALEWMIDQEIIRPLVIYNFGFMENYPKFKFKPINEQDAVEYAKVWLESVKGKAYQPSDEEINHFRNILKFPEGDVERVAPQFPSFAPKAPESKPEEAQIEEQIEKPEVDEEVKEFKKAFNPPEGDFHKRTDIKALRNSLENTENKIKAATNPIVDKIFTDLYDQIQKKKIIQGQHLDRIDSIKIKNLKDLKLALKGNLMDLYRDSKVLAQKDLFKSNFQKPKIEDLFLEILDKENFDYVGDWEFKVTQGARQAMVNGIKDGQSLSEVIEVIDETTKAAALVSLERYARTKTTDVMNKGRKAFFDESGVVAGYQFSAVMDGVTTRICSGLHGKKFKAADAPVPPLHFNALCQDSLIKLPRGSKKISEVKIGDFVQTHKGNYHEVYDVMSKFEDKEYFEIELENGKKLNATGEHPILTDRGWIRVDELNFADNVVCIEDIVDAS